MKIRRLVISFILILFSILMEGRLEAATRYWVASGTGTWNSTSNWSTTSGGAGGASVPGSADKAIFNSLGTGNCTINAAASVGGVQINSGYSGTISHSTGTLSIGAQNFFIGGGTFSTSAYFSCSGSLTISSGTFTSSSSFSLTGAFIQSGGVSNWNNGVSTPSFSGNFTLSGGTMNITANNFAYLGTSFTISGGTFNHSNGNVRFSNAATVSINTTISIMFKDLQFVGNSATTIYNFTSDTLNVSGTLLLSGSSKFCLQNGGIKTSGNISVSNTFNSLNSHTAKILINGSSDQTINSSSSAGSGRLPFLEIKKTTGNLLLSGTISVEGNWLLSKGSVLPQTSTVVFYNSGKYIDSEGNSSTMEFYNVTLGDNNTRILNSDLIIQNVLSLQSGTVNLNANELWIENGLGSAITYSTGGILSENTGNLSKVNWIIGTNSGTHTIPFITSTAFVIPFIFNLTSGDAGTITVSTYPTAANNTPYPVTPQTVQNLFNSFGADNSANTVNRFWQIDKTGPNPVANLTFTYADNEWDIAEPSNYNAQRYDITANVWQSAPSFQTSNPALNQVIVPNVSYFSPWTLATTDNALAIEMSNYEVYTSNQQVKIDWMILSESEISHYRIERTLDFSTIEQIGTMETGVGAYSFIDTNPIPGISFYRVVSIDEGGMENSFEWKSIVINPAENKEPVQVFPNPIQAGKTMQITSVNEISNLDIFDLTGKRIYSEKISSPASMIQYIFPDNISQGCYIISVDGEKIRVLVY
jgi:hypothetical protein